MNLTDDATLKFQCGIPVFLDDVCAVYPATLRDIATVGYEEFQKYLGLLTSSKPEKMNSMDKEFIELFKNLTDFQYLLSLTFFDINVVGLLRAAFKFFIHEDVVFVMEPAQIVVGPPEEKHIIDESNFYDFQRILKRMYFLESEAEEIIINPDDNPMVVAMKKKMKADREKLKRAKAGSGTRQDKNANDLKFSDLIGSLTLNNCGLNMINIWDLTYYAFHDQLKRMGWRDQFNINHQAALAGAKIKKEEMKHWIRSISSDS